MVGGVRDKRIRTLQKLACSSAVGKCCHLFAKVANGGIHTCSHEHFPPPNTGFIRADLSVCPRQVSDKTTSFRKHLACAAESRGVLGSIRAGLSCSAAPRAVYPLRAIDASAITNPFPHLFTHDVSKQPRPSLSHRSRRTERYLLHTCSYSSQLTLRIRLWTRSSTLSGIRGVPYARLNRRSSWPRSKTSGSPAKILRIVFSLRPHTQQSRRLNSVTRIYPVLVDSLRSLQPLAKTFVSPKSVTNAEYV